MRAGAGCPVLFEAFLPDEFVVQDDSAAAVEVGAASDTVRADPADQNFFLDFPVAGGGGRCRRRASEPGFHLVMESRADRGLPRHSLAGFLKLGQLANEGAVARHSNLRGAD